MMAIGPPTVARGVTVMRSRGIMVYLGKLEMLLGLHVIWT
jgi:hypothetical protein